MCTCHPSLSRFINTDNDAQATINADHAAQATINSDHDDAQATMRHKSKIRFAAAHVVSSIAFQPAKLTL